MPLRDSNKRFAVVTSEGQRGHRKYYQGVLPESTEYLCDSNPDLRKFLQHQLLVGVDVVILDADGMPYPEVNEPDAFAFVQDAKDAGKEVLVIYFSDKVVKEKKMAREFERWYRAGIYDVVPRNDKRGNIEEIIEQIVASPADREDVLPEQPKKKRLFGKKSMPVEDKTVFGGGDEVVEHARILSDEPSDTARIKMALQNSGKLPKVEAGEEPRYQVDTEKTGQGIGRATETAAPAEAEGRTENQEARSEHTPQPQSAVSEVKVIDREPQPQEQAILPANVAAVMERMRAEIARDYERREEELRKSYEEKLATAMRMGRRQRAVAVASLVEAMTAEAAQELALMSKNYIPKGKVMMVERDEEKLQSLEAYGFVSPDDQDVLYADVAITDYGADLEAAMAAHADLTYLVLAPTPWTASAQQREWKSLEEQTKHSGDALIVCMPARGPRMQAVVDSIVGSGRKAVYGPDANHYAGKAVVNRDFGASLNPMLKTLALEMDPDFKEPQGNVSNQKPQSKRGRSPQNDAKQQPEAKAVVA